MDDMILDAGAFLKEHADKLADIITKYDGTYAGTWIDSALDFYQQGYFEDAAEAFGKARDSFMPEDTPDEYNTLSAWADASEAKIGAPHDAEKVLSKDVELSGEQVLQSLLIHKADVSELTSDLAGLLSKYKDKYAGTYTSSAVDFYKKGFFEDAAEAFEKARDSFLSDENPEEYNLLDTWSNDSWARSLEVTDVEVASDKVAEEAETLGLDTKSAVEKAEGEPDRKCMQNLWKQYWKFYSGKYISAAMSAYNKKNYSQAAKAFTFARDGFQPKANPAEFNCLDKWRVHCENKAKESK